jgi:hypothetical protein
VLVQVLEWELVQVLVKVQVLEREQALVSEQALVLEQEPVLEQALVPHRQPQSCSQLPPVLV